MEPAFSRHELIPAVIQDHHTGEVLMLGYMNAEAYQLTAQTGEVHFWSRSRQELWHKGETSGHTLAVRSIAVDCDQDTILVRATPAGPACHTGDPTCFGVAAATGFKSLDHLWDTIHDRARNRPRGSYTTELLEGGIDLVGRKLLEEAGELAFAAKNHAAGTGDVNRVVEEAADLIYHLLVLLAEREVEPGEMLRELAGRAAGTGSEPS